MANLPQDTCRDNLMNSINGQIDMTPKDESPRSEGIQYATGEEWRRIINSPRMNEVAGPKWIQHSVVYYGSDSCCVVETEQDPVGSWACKPFCPVSGLLGTNFNFHDLPWVPEDRAHSCESRGFPGGLSGKEHTCQCRLRTHGFNP